MNIYINNDTDYDIEMLRDSVKYACEAALSSEGASANASIGITFVTDDVIKEMNYNYRGIDGITDVLSFPVGRSPDDVLYGDIFICYGQMLRQAADIGNTPEREAMFLTVHGTLHLLGMDHMDEAGEAAMIKKQKEIMNNLP